jgi:tripartite-type tricarboxylate transporter receptor subunit TctC
MDEGGSFVNISRRSILAALAALAGWMAVPGWAQQFPAKPIILICPWPPGGGADAQMRALAQAASKVFGQNVIIENRPGAIGTIGPSALLNARPDGYTLSQATNAVYRQPFIIKTAYDPEKDFTYILGVSGFSFGLAVRTDSGWKSIDDLIHYAKANPGKITFGTFGIGSPPQIVMDRIAAKHGIEWVHLAFKGTAESVAALKGGHVQAIADGTGWGPFVDSGDFRLLATFGARRLARWPSVPTLKDLGYDIEEASPWGIIGPKGMDPAVVKTLHDGFRKAIDEPVFLKMLENLMQEPMYMSTEDYRRYSLGQIPVQKAIVQKYGLARGG